MSSRNCKILFIENFTKMGKTRIFLYWLTLNNFSLNLPNQNTLED